MEKPEKMETFHITTFGCQMNLADSSTLAAAMINRGYRRVNSESEADLIVLNTCSVREKAETRVLGRLGELSRLKQKNPHLRLAVVGCMAQRLGSQLLEQAPCVDYVLGTDRVFDLPDVIRNSNGTQTILTTLGRENIDTITPIKETPFSGFVTISRGCDNYCSYCIVPYVRGKERAHSADFIIDSIRKMVADGVVEITLLGQNVNSYSCDGTDFPALLERAARETDVRRLRFMTSHPKDLSRKLVDVMAGQPKVMPHVHLPLQAGSNRVLQRMGREYTTEHYLEIIDYIRGALDYVCLTTDLLVGFPGETGQEFEMTLKMVEQIEFDSAFMFRYSARPGTAAARLEDDVPEEEKIDRLNKLIRLQNQVSRRRNQREVDQVRFSLVEGTSRRDKAVMRARTEGNKTVLFEASNAAAGDIVPVRITTADAFTLHGRMEETL
ncbi:MAG: tRNA (N6-isopentenyl adenosine(37)-C2)-methylthiotransferase MiaB [Candidatus Zixiibacteriota bacterium]|nr:MAG: tRNA (N6-isopentenyl adenosine(37)-C2)-methylthiotransferase MiaB [candidate division Zixibacteria bacterium]